MKPLEPPDCLHLRAAQGWLELGDHLEANHELDKISPRLRMHPDVLLLCYEIFAKAKWWEAAFYVAQALVEIEPKEPCGWINQAFALRKMISGGAQAAWDALLPAADKFPKNPIIPYNLACYACQMDKLDDARDWLKLAMALGVSDEFKLMALDEPDLKPLCLAIEDI
jgi:predicted Zn-dependent protease